MVDIAVSLALTIVQGVNQTFASATLGAISRQRGGREASLTMQLATSVGLACLLGWIALNEGQTKLPAPLDSWFVFTAAVPLFGGCLWLAMRGLPGWYAVAGLSSLWLVLAPRLIGDLGLALYFSGATLGSSAAALAFDHAGAFGAAKRAVSIPRIGGLLLVGVGVVLVRVA